VIGQLGKQFEHLPFHHKIKSVQGQADPVVRDAILGEVVGANSLVTVARSNQGASHLGSFLMQLFLLEIKQA
jgi:hypothetical protein